jgi:N-acetylmuramoyl-L-alanine amidase
MLPITQDIIPASNNNRPGIPMQARYITVHDTDNTDPGAGAKAHASFIRNTTDTTSWHFTVDDENIIQHIPVNENAWHAGDGHYGTGNRESIGIEICMNPETDRAIAEKNAAQLIAYLYETVPTLAAYPVGVKQHYDWTGKDCPSLIRSRANGWQNFMALVKAEMEADTVEWAKWYIDKLKELGILNGTHKSDDPITFGQVAVLLCRLLRFLGKI